MAGGGNNVNRMSPRQRMINLMYIVLTAMLALNVSSDVLNGFKQVQLSLQRSGDNLSTKNELQFKYLADLYKKNPTKARASYQQGTELHDRTAAIYKDIEEYKVMIARQTDGPTGDYNNIQNTEDLESAAAVMLNPVTHRGKDLRNKIDEYREYVGKLISNEKTRESVLESLNTAMKAEPGSVVVPTWEGKMFENMPAVASITLLTKLQNDLRHAESEAMSTLINNIDIGDIRVNELDAYVIPISNMIMRGGKYSANIVLAAIDTTQRPTIVVNGQRITNPKGLYEFTATSLGTHEFSGYIEVAGRDGNLIKRPFRSSYTVIEPMATISPTMMNVLYAGIDNPISISVPGVPMTAVQASMTNGSLTRSGDSWVARVSNVGAEAVITVSAEIDGRTTSVGSMTFRIRKLPDPTPYLAVKGEGGTTHYKGTPRRISKGALMSASGVGAALDDDIINVTYTVVSFTTIFFDQMGNAIPEVSAGAHFSERQKEQFKRLKPGKSFFISNIKAKGPDGITRDISPMEVGLN